MRCNVPGPAPLTANGGIAKSIGPRQQLRRLVASCMVLENTAFSSGSDLLKLIVDTAHKCKLDDVLDLAVEARTTFGLRHVGLHLVCAYYTHPLRKLAACPSVDWTPAIGRADELAELVSIWWKDGRRPLPAGMKRGLAKAFHKFNGYQFAKYDKDGPVKLRDVLFLCHAKPASLAQGLLFTQIANRSLPTPVTWEVMLSAGADKKETFEALIREGKLGYDALLRNLRNMVDAKCDLDLVRDAIEARKGASRILPFRYVAAARACPALEPSIDKALLASVDEQQKLRGTTVVLVDVSGSMDDKLSAKSDLNRRDAAAALAAVIPAETVRTFSFSSRVVEVPTRRGMAGIDAIIKSQYHQSTEMAEAVRFINEAVPHDRLIVITDEQTSGQVPDPVCEHAYVINVASAKNGVGYGRWTHIDGFSEAVLSFIREIES